MKKTYLLTSLLVIPTLASCGAVSWVKGPTNAVDGSEFVKKLEEELETNSLFLLGENQKAFSYDIDFVLSSKDVIKHYNNGVKINKQKESALDTLNVKFDSTNHLLKEVTTENQYYTYKGRKTAETNKESNQIEARDEKTVYDFNRIEKTYTIEKVDNAYEDVDLVGKTTASVFAIIIYGSMSEKSENAKYYVDGNVYTVVYDFKQDEGDSTKEEHRKVQFEINENGYSLIINMKGKETEKDMTRKSSEKGTLVFKKKKVNINYSKLNEYELKEIN